MVNILEGDCLERIKDVEDNSVNLVVTSPPYADTVSYGDAVNVFHPDNYPDWFLKLGKQIHRVLTDDGSFILNINTNTENGKFSTYVMKTVIALSEQSGLTLHDEYIWYKRSCMPNGSEKRLHRRTEYIYHFVKTPKQFKTHTDRVRTKHDEVTINRNKYEVMGNDIVGEDGITTNDKRLRPLNESGKIPFNVFRFNTAGIERGVTSGKHPAPFGKELPEWFIRWLTDAGDTVLDPFFGSGTTGVVCEEMDRECIGIEMNPEYIKISNERLEPYNNNLKEFFG